MLELLFSALPELIAVTPVLLIGLLPSALLVMLALLFGGLGFVDQMKMEDAILGAVSGLILGGVVCGFFYALLRFGLRDGKYRRLVERAVETAGIPQEEREQLGTELLAARDDPKGRI